MPVKKVTSPDRFRGICSLRVFDAAMTAKGKDISLSKFAQEDKQGIQNLVLTLQPTPEDERELHGILVIVLYTLRAHFASLTCHPVKKCLFQKGTKSGPPYDLETGKSIHLLLGFTGYHCFRVKAFNMSPIYCSATSAPAVLDASKLEPN